VKQEDVPACWTAVVLQQPVDVSKNRFTDRMKSNTVQMDLYGNPIGPPNSLSVM